MNKSEKTNSKSDNSIANKVERLLKPKRFRSLLVFPCLANKRIRHRMQQTLS